MTQNPDQAGRTAVATQELPQQPAPQTNQRATRNQWRGRILLILVVGFIAAYLINTLPPYLTLNPKEARILLNPHFPAHYAVLIAHIAFGTIALAAVCLQVWPWLRRRHPKVHRISGRVYIFAGAIPCALLALVLDRVTVIWEANLGITMQALLLLGTAVAGYVAVRRGNYASHRRWMLYSFAVVTSVISGRAGVILYTHLPVVDRPNPDYLFEFARWFNWIINLVVVQWWIEYTARRRGGRNGAQPAVAGSAGPIDQARPMSRASTSAPADAEPRR